MKVVAAVIRRKGAILIGQRRHDDRHPFKWEFPGGKVEVGERSRQALVRELKEELGIAAKVGPEITRYMYRYSGRAAFQLIFFWVDTFEGEPQNLAFETIAWVELSELPSYDFLDGDREFVRALARGETG